MRPSTREKLRRVKSAPALIGWLLIIKPIVQFISHVGDVDFAISASGNERMVALWNFFATPSGNVVLTLVGFVLLAYLVMRPEKELVVTIDTPTPPPPPAPAHNAEVVPPRPQSEAEATPRMQVASTELEARRAVEEPNLVFRTPVIVLSNQRHEDHTFVEDPRGYPLLIIEIRNDAAVSRPVAAVRVRAVISFEEVGGGHSVSISDGVWMRERGRDVYFRLGDLKSLVIAYRLREGATKQEHVFAVRHHIEVVRRRRLFRPELIKLTARRYTVEVQLYAESPLKMVGARKYNLIAQPELRIEEVT